MQTASQRALLDARERITKNAKRATGLPAVSQHTINEGATVWDANAFKNEFHVAAAVDSHAGCPVAQATASAAVAIAVATKIGENRELRQPDQHAVGISAGLCTWIAGGATADVCVAAAEAAVACGADTEWSRQVAKHASLVCNTAAGSCFTREVENEAREATIAISNDDTTFLPDTDGLPELRHRRLLAPALHKARILSSGGLVHALECFSENEALKATVKNLESSLKEAQEAAETAIHARYVAEVELDRVAEHARHLESRVKEQSDENESHLEQIARLENKIHLLETGGVGVALSPHWNAPSPVPSSNGSVGKVTHLRRKVWDDGDLVLETDVPVESIRPELTLSSRPDPKALSDVEVHALAKDDSRDEDDLIVEARLDGDKPVPVALSRSPPLFEQESATLAMKPKKQKPPNLKVICGADGKSYVEVTVKGETVRFQPDELDSMGPVTRRDLGLEDALEATKGEPTSPLPLTQSLQTVTGASVNLEPEVGAVDNHRGGHLRSSGRRRKKGWLHLQVNSDSDGD